MSTQESMTLCLAALMQEAAKNLPAATHSPSSNPCMVSVHKPGGRTRRYRNDPYNGTVVPESIQPVSPSVMEMVTVLRPYVQSSLGELPTTSSNPAAPAPEKTAAAAEIPPSEATSSVAAAPSESVGPHSECAPQLTPTNIDALEGRETASLAASSSSSSSSTTHYAVVKFKYESFTYVAPFRVSRGDLVVVDGDRGVHCGTVSDVSTTTPPFPVSNRILRKATPKDRSTMQSVTEREKSALATVRRMAESSGLTNIRILDVEYQLDMNKLTIYFRAKTTYIDFRKLQRGLFKEFRCRIWLSHMDEVEAIEKQHCR